jgi:Primase C terminal 2 (PriCT-2)/Family of unknown function (DUF5906)
MSFYSRVLPSVGPFTLLAGVTGPDGALAEQREVKGLQTHAALEKAVQELSVQPLNIFFGVGSYTHGRKAKDAIAKRALFLDLDGKDFDGSIENAYRDLSAFVRAVGLPPPSIFVNSGRGLHVYWCLDRDYTIDEWKPVAEALKAKCAELNFNADKNCTADVSRVLRCPGTLNRKGQEPIPCYIMADNGSTYTLASLAQQLGTSAAAMSPAASQLKLLAPADALISKPSFKPLTSEEVESLLAAISLPPVNNRDLWTEVLRAVQDWGDKSEESWSLFDEWSSTQPGYNQQKNRTTWESFHPGGGITVGTLIKIAREHGWEPDVPPPVTPAGPQSLAEQVAAQPDFTEESAEPTVQLSVVSDPLMVHAQTAVNNLGKARFDKGDAVQFLSSEFVIISEQEGVFYSKTQRAAISKPVIDDLLTRYMPLNAAGQPIAPTRMIRNYGVKDTAHALGFHPAAGFIYRELGKNYVNQYSPPATPIPGTPDEILLIETFWKWMFPKEEDQEFAQYIRNCYGHVVQKPAIKIDSAPLIVAPANGTGKTTLAGVIPRLLVGELNSQEVSNKTLKGSFSGYINGKHFLHFDEIHVNGKWDSDDTANALKNVITGKLVEVRPLYMNPFNIVNRVFVTATSNYEDAMSLPNDSERRWGVYAHTPPACSAEAKAAFFDRLYAFLESPRGAGVLRWYFMTQVDLSGFRPWAKPPMTNAKRFMIKKSQTKEVRILQDAIEEGIAPFDRELLLNEKVQQYLHSETSKTYSTYEVREFIAKALPEAVRLKQVRPASGGNPRNPIAWKNQEYWTDPARTTAEIKKELG